MKRYYTTTSLAIASALQTVSPSKLEFLSKLPKSNNFEFNFDLEKDPELELLAEKFLRRQLLGDLFTYSEAMKYIKTRIYHQ